MYAFLRKDGRSSEEEGLEKMILSLFLSKYTFQIENQSLNYFLHYARVEAVFQLHYNT